MHDQQWQSTVHGADDESADNRKRTHLQSQFAHSALNV